MEALMPMLNDAIAEQLRQHPYAALENLQRPTMPPPQSYGDIATGVLMSLAPLALGMMAGGSEGGEGERPPTRPTTPLAMPRETVPLRPADAPLWTGDPVGRSTRLLSPGTRPLYGPSSPGFEREPVVPGIPWPLEQQGLEGADVGRFHGTYPDRPMLTLGDPKKFARPGLMFSRGLYTTDNFAVGSGYAQEGQGYIYRIHEIRPVKFLENRQNIPDDVWEQLGRRPAWRNLRKNQPHIKVGDILHFYAPLKLPMGLRTTAAQEEFITAAERAGYGGFKHIGGGGPRGSPYHQVKIYWNPERDTRPRLIAGGSMRGTSQPLPAGLTPEALRELERRSQDFEARKYWQTHTGLSGPQPPHKLKSVVLPPEPPDTSFLKPLNPKKKK